VDPLNFAMNQTPPALAKLKSPVGIDLAYRAREGTSPTLLFLPGYASDMDGAKAVALDAFAADHGVAMLRFDYSGTGSSGGQFEGGTLSVWLDEARAMIDALTDGPLILIGSSMGGWIALHLALQIPERVQALVGIAAAPDFTEWGFTPEDKARLLDDGQLKWPSAHGGDPQLTTRRFWESGQAMRLLRGPIAVDCPVRLIHGQADEDVPLDIAMQLMARLRSADVQLKIVKGGGHRLSQPHEIEAIVRTVAELLEPDA
jgi:pimeloyl-ACP methyl ester carboxylesterase